MKYLEFNNGDKLPALGLGTWKSKPGEVYQAVRHAIKVGYRHIDCARIYMNETEIGKAFSDAFAEGDVKREDLWITSKLWNNVHRKEQVLPALEQTLKDLQLDYLDLYLVHWPVVHQADVLAPKVASDMIPLSEVPIIETWTAMEEMQTKGLTKHIGVSNFSIKKLSELIAQTQVKPEMNQIELHPFLQQDSMLEFCKSENIHLTAYSPLGSIDKTPAGLAQNKPSLLEEEAILEVAQKHTCTPAQVLIAWAMERGTAVIPKSVNPDRIQQNFEASNLELDAVDMKLIAECDRHYRFVDGTFWAVEGSTYTVENLWDE